MQMTSQ